MITLYELRWSHYCEKIRWALRLKGLEWQAVSINAFSKRELAPFPPGPSGLRLVPMLYDERTGRHIYESTPILKYLDETYSPRMLFPSDQEESKAVEELLIEFDTYLALGARRLGYAQLILEHPTALSQLFLSSLFGGVLTWWGVRRVASAAMGMMLLKRFDLHKNEEVGLYEAVEEYLERVASRLGERRYLIANTLTAADIALATQLRPLTIVPHFMENARLRPLFEWRGRLLQDHGGELTLQYEDLIAQARRNKPPVRRRFSAATKGISSIYPLVSAGAALNDQRPIWTGSIVKVPFWYFATLRRNSVRCEASRSYQSDSH